MARPRRGEQSPPAHESIGVTMHSFLLWIGAYNVLGSLVVLVCLRPSWGEKLLGA